MKERCVKLKGSSRELKIEGCVQNKVRRINFFQAFRIQQTEAKVETKPAKPRKAPLSVSHGGPTTILKKARKFVEKDKINTLLNMNMIFENINKTKKSMRDSSSRASGAIRGISPVTQLEDENSEIDKQEKEFLHLISDRITKKMFLTKQKLRFLREKVVKKKGKVIYEGTEADNLISLDRKIELYQEVLRHIREKSVHRMHLRQFRIVFSNDPEAIDIADKLTAYQK